MGRSLVRKDGGKEGREEGSEGTPGSSLHLLI